MGSTCVIERTITAAAGSKMQKKSPMIPILFLCISILNIMHPCMGAGPDDLMHAAEHDRDTVRIGLLVPDQGSMSREATDAVRLAIDQHNQQAQHPRIFELVTASCEGPWGVASKASVRLLHEMDAVAMITSLDGRNAHLAEQVAVKSQKIMLATRSTDPSLAYAFVPWFFRCVPDDVRQAEWLLSVIDTPQEVERIALVGGEDYDSEMAMNTFHKSALKKPTRHLKTFICCGSESGAAEVADLILKFDPSAVVFFDGPAVHSAGSMLRQAGGQMPYYGHLNVVLQLGEQILTEEFLQGATVIAPSSVLDATGRQFKRQFVQRNGYAPGVLGAYVYDGAKLLMQAIETAGTGTANLQKYLESTVFDDGVTGTFQFDGYGNRRSDASIIRIGR
jgi:ABC-type branched-subunit amino acid transport system substrate-binding protein